jgi:hypothetical protein
MRDLFPADTTISEETPPEEPTTPEPATPEPTTVLYDNIDDFNSAIANNNTHSVYIIDQSNPDMQVAYEFMPNNVHIIDTDEDFIEFLRNVTTSGSGEV